MSFEIRRTLRHYHIHSSLVRSHHQQIVIKMRQSVWTFALFLVCLSALCNFTQGRIISKRQAGDEIDPTKQEADADDDSSRDKRKVDVKYGVKNAILGFVFNKINSFIDQKTAWVDQLDRTNIEKNRIHGIEAPKDPVVSLSGILSGVIGQKLQAAAPLVSIVTNKLSGGSGGPGGGSGGFNFGSILGGLGGLSGGSSGGGHTAPGIGASLSASYGAV